MMLGQYWLIIMIYNKDMAWVATAELNIGAPSDAYAIPLTLETLDAWRQGCWLRETATATAATRTTPAMTGNCGG
jgi:hypothetical protein